MKMCLALLSCLLLPVLNARAGDFAFALYGRLRTSDGNLFFSPASIESALGMTRAGAAGNTLRQMSLLLPAPAPLPPSGTQMTLESANALWIDHSFPVLEPFRTAVQSEYAADLLPANFIEQPEAERGRINRWVEEKTREKIKNLLPQGSVNAETRVIVVNAIYFKGDWLTAFEKEKTAEAPFTVSEDKRVQVPMMTLSPHRFRYMENESFQFLELPYQGEEASMLLLLPSEPGGLYRVEKALSADALSGWIASLRTEEVQVSLPTFKIESEFSSLSAVLSAMGMPDAFNPALADFSGISREPLFISDVVHKAFVQVDEEGTEAAAATGVIMRTTSMPAPPKLFRADHPFLFLIRHNASGKILFIGRVCDPSP